MEPMRLVAVLPHQRFRKLDEQRFACECGAYMSDVVARLD